MQMLAINTEAQTILSELDEKIAKLKHLRGLLSDTTVWALVSHAWLINAAPVERRRRATGQYGGIVKAAYRCVQAMDGQLFTKAELAERVRTAGHKIRNHRHAMYYPVQRLIKDEVIELVERGGGKRENTYRRVQASHAAPSKDTAQGGIASLMRMKIPRGNTFRSGLMKTAFECVRQFSEPFASWQLIRAMERAGHEFILSAESSIQPVLRKLVREGFLLIVREQSDEEPTLYERRYEDNPLPSHQP